MYSIKLNRDRILKPQEWNLFIEKLNSKDSLKNKFLYECQLNTGARFNEIVNVKVEDVDFENKNITLKVVKKRTNYSDGRQRIIPISSTFMGKLYNYIKEKGLSKKDYLFSISQPGYNQLLKRKLKEIGVKEWKEFSSHNLRKTLETWLASLDIGSLKILRHFGHFKSTALKYYIQIDYFTIEEKIMIRKIIGDLYMNNSEEGNILHKRIDLLEERIKKIRKNDIELNKLKEEDERLVV